MLLNSSNLKPHVNDISNRPGCLLIVLLRDYIKQHVVRPLEVNCVTQAAAYQKGLLILSEWQGSENSGLEECLKKLLRRRGNCVLGCRACRQQHRVAGVRRI
jgi:hypothetical protein